MKNKRTSFFDELPRYVITLLRLSMANPEYIFCFVIGTLLIVDAMQWFSVPGLLASAVMSFCFGVLAVASIIWPVDKAFTSLGISFAEGYGTPTWIVDGKYPARQNTIRIRAAGCSASDFERNIEQLASRLNRPIKSIVKPRAEEPVIEVAFRTTHIPRHLQFSKLDLSLLGQGQFFVGQSDDRLETLSLSDMIHMLVAGRTGAGKTQFLRQMLYSILARTKNAHVCLIDMKGGIDFQAFASLPNVEMVVTYEAAQALLNECTTLYEKRRDLILAKKKSKWSELSVKDLESDTYFKGKPIGPLLVVVDELAELSLKATKASANSDLQEKLATLARLARFTGIHLILGTQRPDKMTINMQSKENLPTRVCFSVPSVAASTLVVNDMSASTLGNIPGRAVYKGSETKIVQSPLITNQDLENGTANLKSRLIQNQYKRRVLSDSPLIVVEHENEVLG